MLKSLITLVICSWLLGCASTPSSVSYDPYESYNRINFELNEFLDKNLLKPIANGYVKVAPAPVRGRITNFFENIGYLNIILNDFLQGNVDHGLSGVTRVVFNSTIGIGGLHDVATAMNLPKRNEDFGQTLGVWGVGRGSYWYLPFFGPNTTRNIPNFLISIALSPLTYVGGQTFIATGVNAVNQRANLLRVSDLRDEVAVDVYAFTREAFLQRREFLIYNGNPPIEGIDDILNEDDDLLYEE